MNFQLASLLVLLMAAFAVAGPPEDTHKEPQRPAGCLGLADELELCSIPRRRDFDNPFPEFQMTPVEPRTLTHEADIRKDPEATLEIDIPPPVMDFQGSASVNLLDNKKIENAVGIARELLVKSSGNASFNELEGARAIFDRLKRKIDQVIISRPAAGKDYKACVSPTAKTEGKVLGFIVPTNPDKIYLCSRLKIESDKLISQILIHLVAHHTGYTDECSASKIEVATHHWSFTPLNYVNTTWSHCGVVWRSEEREKFEEQTHSKK